MHEIKKNLPSRPLSLAFVDNEIAYIVEQNKIAFLEKEKALRQLPSADPAKLPVQNVIHQLIGTPEQRHEIAAAKKAQSPPELDLRKIKTRSALSTFIKTLEFRKNVSQETKVQDVIALLNHYKKILKRENRSIWGISKDVKEQAANYALYKLGGGERVANNHWAAIEDRAAKGEAKAQLELKKVKQVLNTEKRFGGLGSNLLGDCLAVHPDIKKQFSELEKKQDSPNLSVKRKFS